MESRVSLAVQDPQVPRVRPASLGPRVSKGAQAQQVRWASGLGLGLRGYDQRVRIRDMMLSEHTGYTDTNTLWVK